MTTPSHALRTDGGGSLGFGHVNRCLIIADAIRARGGTPELVLGVASAEVLSHVRNAGYACRQLDPAARFDAGQVLLDAHSAVFDFSHRETRAHLANAQDMLRASRAAGARTMLIDAKGEECLSALSAMETDILAIPYAGAESEQVLPGAKVDVRGLQYFALAHEYLDDKHTARDTPEIATKILVTAGGSDPVGLTEFFLDVLDPIHDPLEIRIVIGPGFRSSQAKTIASRAERMPHNTELVNAPENLADEIFRADLALSASGLTKYELAFAGTPSVLLSIDENHDIANRPFAALGSCVDAGRFDAANPVAVRDLVATLIRDPVHRRIMATAGPAAIDGRGTQRLLDLLDG